MQPERRKEKRRKFTYYMRVVDANTLQPIGYLTEISAMGIQVDSEKPLPVGVNYTLRMELTAEVANKSYMTFTGRSKWCRADKLTPNQYYIGFEVDITAPDDAEIFNRMIEKYGTESGK
jgi:hypothetical protein